MYIAIQYNYAFDALAAMFKYSGCYFPIVHKLPASEANMPKIDFTPSKQIKSWLADVDAKISPFMKSDMELLTRKVVGFFDTYSDLLIENNLESIDDLLTLIQNMPSDDLTRRVFQYYGVDIPYEADNKVIHEHIVKEHDEETANIFIQIKRFPDEYKTKIISLIDNFCRLFILPHKDYVDHFISEKLISHNAKFKKNPVEFLNAVGLGDYSKIISNVPDTKILLSYYIDRGIYYGMFGTQFGIYYGFYMEERLHEEADHDRYKNLFKALADERRLEIIRLTSKRPWYNKELADYFGLTTATLSYHLNLLLDMGILNFEPSDNNRYYYTTNKEILREVFEASLNSLIAE